MAAVSAAMVLGALGFIGYEAWSGEPTLPAIEVTVDTIVDTGAGYVVQFRARNRGGLTAKGLEVEAELRSDTGTVERASASIDYVPGGATRTAGLVFVHDPRRFTLDVRAKGYDLP